MTRATLQRPPSFLLVPIGLALLGACAWSVPADPGLNSRLRRRPAPATAAATPPGASTAFEDEGARVLYVTRCGACHAPWPPTHVRAAEWPIYVARYGPRAGLFGAERARVLRWLQAHAE
jgi:cytochrome c5